MRHALTLFALAGLLALPSASRGQEPIEPALALNESVLSKLKQLQPNQAVLLGQAQVVGEFNDVARQFDLHKTGPRGRDFTIKMVWAPERRRALFCGANHGTPHRLNDVWEFDLTSLSWVLLYAPDNPRDYTGIGKDYSDVEFRDGVLITKRGGPAVIAHTWWGLTYDQEQKQMLFMNTWVTDQKKAVQQLGGDPGQLYAGPPLWAFSPSSGQWKMLKTSEPYPRPIFGGMLEFIPELKGSIWHANNWQMQATWLYDSKANTWRNFKPNGGTADFQQQAAEPEQVGYYDPKRKLVIVQRHKATHHYDVRANTWRKVISADKDSEQAPHGHDAHAPMYLDPVSGHGLLLELKTNTLWAYDPDKPSWTKLAPEGDSMPDGNKRLVYFDPAHNVFVVIRDTAVWAYRYR
jgi:hypothetical protein